jgi:hypothetical protein
LTSAATNLGGKVAQLNSTIEAQRTAVRDLKGGWQGTAADAALARAERDLAKQTGFRDRLQQAQRALQTGGTYLGQAKGALVGIVNTLRAQGWQVSDDGVATPPPTLPPVLKNTAQAWTAAVQRLLTLFGEIDKQTAGSLPKFSPLSTDGPVLVDGDKRREDEEQAKRAEQDVQDALAGDQEAARRVAEVLGKIVPGQPLTPEQGSYLSQMQAQQNGMTVEELKTAEQRLGDQKHIIADSWQLMSNDDVTFPETPTEVGALDNPNQMVQGGFEKLPQSVQNTLNAPDIQGAAHLQDIAGIVRNGDDKFQTNTQLDRGMLKKAAVMMDTPFWQQSAEEYNLPPDQRLKYLDPVVSDVFTAVSPDHHAVHDAITTGPGHIDGIDSEKFMQGVTHRIWADGGEGAGDLFEWTQSTHGPEATIAAETARTYAEYLGGPGGDLLDLPGHHSIGEINPKLVQAFGHGLAPYQEAMIGDPAGDNGFTPLDGLGGDMPNTRNLFAVIDSDPEAAKHFNGQAYLQAAEYQQSFATAAASDPMIDGTDPRQDDLRKAGRLLGLVDAGADIETRSHNVNEQQSAYDHAKASYDLKNAAYETIAANIPGGERVAAALQDGFIGPEPQERDFPPGTYTTDVGPQADQRDLGNAVTQAQYTIAAGMVDGPNVDIPSTYFNNDGSLMTPAEVREQFGEAGWDDYSSKLQAYVAKYPSLFAHTTDFQFTFGNITGIGPSEPPK